MRNDLEHLTRTGQWQTDSIVRACLTDPKRRDLLRRKVADNLDVLEGASSECAAHAAHEITRELSPEDFETRRNLFRSGQWYRVLYAILGHAICSADNGAASAVVDAYAAEFGIPITTDVLSATGQVGGIEDATVTAATDNVRKQVLDRCRLDLTTELPAGERSTHSIISFLHYLDDELWRQLSEYAQRLLTDGAATLAELGARFVWVRQLSEDTVVEFFEEKFTELVSQHLWDFSALPAQDDQEHDPETLDYRTMIAADKIREADPRGHR